jgi:hypothetical protein
MKWSLLLSVLWPVLAGAQTTLKDLPPVERQDLTQAMRTLNLTETEALRLRALQLATKAKIAKVRAARNVMVARVGDKQAVKVLDAQATYEAHRLSLQMLKKFAGGLKPGALRTRLLSKAYCETEQRLARDKAAVKGATEK